jgi:hypothetical protein
MTIEDRVRRVLTEAVADEPLLHGAPLQAALRGRRRRPVLAGAVAVVLVLGAVIGLVAVRRPSRVLPAAPTLTTLPTTGWPEVTDDAGNFRFRHPPGWDVRPTNRGGAGLKDGWVLTPPDVPRGNAPRSGFAVTVTHGHGYWKADSFGLVGSGQVGRVPGGQAYLRTAANSPQRGTYAIDWGRVCRAGTPAPGSCAAQSVQVEYASVPPGRHFDRYRAEVETVVASLRALRPTSPTVGDRSRPACQPGQWALVHPSAWGGTPDGRRLAVPVGVGFRGGPPCHLHVPVSMAVEQDGRRLPIQGNPATATIELDLPEDALPAGYKGIRDDRILQVWTWDERCDQQAGITASSAMVFSDDRGRRLLTLGNRLAGFDPAQCTDRSRRSVLAAWP